MRTLIIFLYILESNFLTIMAENSNKKLTPEVVQTMTSLTSVRRISDLPQIQVYDIENERIKLSNNFNNSYILSSTYLEDESRYYNYRVKLNELTYYLNTISTEEISAFRNIFDYFVNTLKEQTENSYVRFKPLNTDYNLNEPLENYAYTFDYQLSYIQNEYSYVFSYNEYDENGEIINEYSTYAYVNKLKPGLVTNNVLEEYVQLTLGRILGVPSTPAYVSAAIDSVIEFVDWFKGYNKDQDGLHELVTRIDAKDAEIITSYTVADTAINTRIDNLDMDATAVVKQYITGFKQEDGLITNVTRKQIEMSDVSGLNDAINNIDVDVPIDGVDNAKNSFTAGGVKYELNIDNNKKLYFSTVNELTFTLSKNVNDNYEYMANTPTSMTITYNTSKLSSVKWGNTYLVGSINSQPHTGNGTWVVSLNNKGNNSYTLYAYPADGFSTKDKSISCNFNQYKYYYWTSTADNETTLNENNSSNLSTTGRPSSLNFALGNTTRKYIYLLIKANTSDPQFYVGNTGITQQNAGGMLCVNSNITMYDNIQYKLWRTTEDKISNITIRLG